MDNLVEGPWEQKHKIREWGEKLTILGSAIIGIGAILLAVAAFWHPSPKRKKRIPIYDEGADTNDASAESLHAVESE